MNFCDACETCSHCLKNGCMPIVPVAREVIVASFAGEALTNRQVCDRTGMTMKNVAAHLVQLRNRGRAEKIEGFKPIVHRIVVDRRETDDIVQSARASQPVSVFMLAQFIGAAHG